MIVDSGSDKKKGERRGDETSQSDYNDSPYRFVQRRYHKGYGNQITTLTDGFDQTSGLASLVENLTDLAECATIEVDTRLTEQLKVLQVYFSSNVEVLTGYNSENDDLSPAFIARFMEDW